MGTVGSLVGSWSPSTGVWYHVAFARVGNSGRAFIDGAQVGSTADMTGVTLHNSSRVLTVGSGTGGEDALNGWMDEIRVSKAVGRHSSNFAPPNRPYW